MTIYLDPPDNWNYNVKNFSHLWSLDTDELNQFASELGINPQLIIKFNPSFIHYIVFGEKRRLALQKGAVEITKSEMQMKIIQNKGKWD